MKTIVIVPTYNERDNMARLIPALLQQFRDMQHEMHLLVVDDTSPDGTAAIVADWRARFGNIHLLVGPKAGLGAAYIRGMEHAVYVLGADVVFEMDADFSHSPSDIPRLMDALEQGADVAIGSRYVAGGAIPAQWGILRRAASVVGNVVARYVAGIYRVRDCTAGFRAIRASVLRRVDLHGLRVQGYAFQVALLHSAVAQAARIVEVPVHFADRIRGESKLGFSDVVEFARNAWWIRFQDSRTFIKFAVVGACGVVVNLGLFSLLLRAGLSGFLASPLATEVSIIGNFLFNNYWTFRHRRKPGRLHVTGLKFNAVSVLALAVSYLVFVALSLWRPTLAPAICQLAGIIPATLVNYFLNSYWTFRGSADQ
jgi:dolichol-phosphate mannosyltransferase